MPGWNWQKIKQMLINILRLSFYYLKIIHIFQLLYYPNIVGDILKNKQKKTKKNNKSVYSLYCMINYNGNEDENEK